jgi:outer membrane receptor protein involved in Fe transport
LRAAAYTGFRLPTLNELYRPFVVFPITTQANAALGLERLRGVEGGVDLKPLDHVTLSVTGFYNRLENAIANVTLSSTLRQRQNVDAIVAKGIELTAHASHGAFSFDGSYAFSDSKVEASGSQRLLDGQIPSQSPRHTGSATLAWASTAGFGASATVRYVGNQYEDDQQTDVIPAVTTIDGVITVPVGHRVAIVGRAENLFDATVITRNVTIESGGTNPIDLGTPRTLWIGVRLR